MRFLQRSIVRNLFLAMLGTGLVMGLAFPLVVGPFAVFKAGMRATFAGLCIGAGLVVGALNFFLVRAVLLRKVELVSTQIQALAGGEGTMTSRLDFVSDDALGRLVERFNALLGRLEGSIRQVVNVVEAYLSHAAETSTTAHALAESANRKTEVVEGSAILLAGLRQEFKTMSDIIAHVQDSAAESRAAVANQVEQNEKVKTQIDQLLRQSQTNADGIQRASLSIQRTSSHSQELTRALDEAAASMTEMDFTVREIEQNLTSSGAIAERVAADAGQGEEAVRSMQEAMERIRTSVEAAAAAIRSYTAKVTEIAAVTEVIDEVTEQTNLLALNAAIIAAQAGRHGQGFAVVAGQIKKLADRTSASTQAIDGLIRGFQEQAGVSLSSMSQSQDAVQNGVVLSHRATDALDRIRESAGHSHLQVQSIGKAIQEIAATTHHLSQTVESIAGRAKEISSSTREQESNLAGLGATVQETRQVATALVAVSQAQLGAARMIQTQTETVGGLIQDSRESIKKGREETELLSTTMETIQRLDSREREGFSRCETEADRLIEQSRLVKAEIERLRPRGPGAPAAGRA